MCDVFIFNALTCREGELQKKDILIKDGKITSIGKNLDGSKALIKIDAQNNYVIPGLIDIHTHGSAGIDVNSAKADDLARISEFFAAKGCTRWLASILSDSDDKTISCLHEIKRAMTQPIKGAKLLGVHLEGPFLSSQFKGAMPESLLQNGNVELFDRYLAESGHNIKYLTVAPEIKGVMELIKYASDKGVVVSIGHSGAGYDLAMESIQKGVKSCTHTFNGMRLFHQHEPSLMAAVLENDDVYCEFICDYLHLHPGAVKFLIKVKGISKVLGITDSISATGLPDGDYMLGINEVVVKNGDARLKVGDSRAGSTLTINRALKNVMDITKLPLEKAIVMFGENQAKMLGIFDEYGSIDIGKYADLVILSKDYEIIQTIVEGETVYNANK